MEIKVFVVDDETDSLELVCSLLENDCEIELSGFAKNADDALKQISNNPPDLVICDVHMPGTNGIELAREIRNKYEDTEVMFLTAYNNYALDAIKLEALDYILKPVDPDELYQAIERMKIKMKPDSLSEDVKLLLSEIRKTDKIRFNNMTGFILLRPAEIFYIEADGNYSNIYLTDGNVEVASQNLLCLEKKLSSLSFFRLSRSHLLNMEYVAGIDRRKKQCILKNGDNKVTIPIPTERVKEISKML